MLSRLNRDLNVDFLVILIVKSYAEIHFYMHCLKRNATNTKYFPKSKDYISWVSGLANKNKIHPTFSTHITTFESDSEDDDRPRGKPLIQ